MKRRTLDVIFSIGGVGAAVLLVVLGFVMTSNANFAHSYVHDQLVQQKVAFPAASKLTKEEAASPCVSKYAGMTLSSGKQAECYANDFIGLHVKGIANGETYATIGTLQSGVKAQIAAITDPTDPKLAGLNTQLATLTGQRESLFKGETLRGLLLTSYGFSTFGVKAAQAATVAYAGAALLALMTAAGLAHAAHTSRSEAFAPVEKVGRKTKQVPVHA